LAKYAPLFRPTALGHLVEARQTINASSRVRDSAGIRAKSRRKDSIENGRSLWTSRARRTRKPLIYIAKQLIGNSGNVDKPGKVMIWGLSVSAEGIGAVIATVVIVVAFFLYLFVRH
jgi:hypothetical protein